MEKTSTQKSISCYMTEYGVSTYISTSEADLAAQLAESLDSHARAARASAEWGDTVQERLYAAADVATSVWHGSCAAAREATCDGMPFALYEAVKAAIEE